MMKRKQTMFTLCSHHTIQILVPALLSIGMCSIHAEIFQGIGVVNEDGSIKMEAEAMETWNGCIEIKNEVCGKICDPYGTKHEKGGNCWNNENKDYCSPPSSGLMGVGMCGTHSFVDFMPVPKATSFAVRHTKVTKDFTFNIFINGEPWRKNITFPPSSYLDSSGQRVQVWKDTIFQNVPLDQDQNFIRIQRTGTGIPTIDYITVYPDGVGNARMPAPFTQDIATVNLHGKTITYSLAHRNQVTLDIIDAAGRIVQQLDNGIREAGTYALSLNNRPVRGVFFVRLRSNDMQVTNRLVTVE